MKDFVSGVDTKLARRTYEGGLLESVWNEAPREALKSHPAAARSACGCKPRVFQGVIEVHHMND